MAEKTIPELTLLTSIDRGADLFEVSDTSDSGNSKRTTINSMLDLTSHPVGIDDIQTLTQKTLTAPTISSPVLSGTATGTYTLGGTPTFPSAVVTLTGSQTLSNKVLTSPTINSPTITNPTITVDTLSEFTAANGITIDGLNIKDGKVGANGVNTASIEDSAVTGAKIATYKIVRQNDTSNTTETTARILTGWGVIAYNTGATNVNEAITFNSAFTSAPIVTVTFGGDHATLQTYGSGGNLVEATINAKALLITTTGFTVYLHKPTGGNLAAGYGFYQWTAIGV